MQTAHVPARSITRQQLGSASNSLTAGKDRQSYESGAAAANAGANQVQSLTLSPFPNPSHMRCALVVFRLSRRPDGQARRMLRKCMPGRDRLPVNGGGMTSILAPIICRKVQRENNPQQKDTSRFDSGMRHHGFFGLSMLPAGVEAVPFLTGNEKPAVLDGLHGFRRGFFGKKPQKKGQRSRVPDIGARWQSGSERRLTTGQTGHLGEGPPRPSFEENGAMPGRTRPWKPDAIKAIDL